MFKQYFTKKAYQKALDDGVKFYEDTNEFNNFRRNLSANCEIFTKFFESKIKDKEKLSKDTIETFFEHTKKLCGDYTKMNFEFTDKAFSLQEENPIIKKNLSEMSKFKDKIRNFMNMVIFEPDGYLYKLFNILAGQFSLPVSIFDNLTQKETLALFEGKEPNIEVASSRQRAFAESYNINHPIDGNDAKLILQEFREEVEYTDIIKGQGASMGKASGKVKIIPVDYSDLNRINEEIKKMKQGNILVAETTAPELMIACKKAGAIVTDMGGLMSHAAIISREFRIPCIVGTKFASKILKDGDEVEVDANKGTVKIRKN
jgi:phosphohistidine swiveling domain-containing protein